MSYNKIDFNCTTLNDGFWKQKQRLNEDVTAMAVYKRFFETNRFDALKCKPITDESAYKPHIFWDSDVAKWIEGVGNILSQHENKELEALADSAIDDIAKSQQENGYYNAYYLVMDQDKKFAIRDNHELYCAGHLMEAGVAYYNGTGKRTLLDVACKLADLIYDVFYINKNAAFTTCGHPEIELALNRLYEATKQDKYLTLSKFFIDMRGNNQKDIQCFARDYNPAYSQSHIPLKEQRTAIGHAVRAGYIYSAMADIARLCDDKELYIACASIFHDIITKKMYITGGAGQTYIGEAFTVDYDLQNKTAYAETCAAISMAFFGERMLLMEPQREYADIIEKEIYNGFLSGWSQDGKAFFYENPLEINPDFAHTNTSTKDGPRLPIMERMEVFDCSCCPPNVVRFVSSIADYIYTQNHSTLFVHQFMSSKTKTSRGTISQKTSYPINGEIEINLDADYTCLAVRIPGWCQSFSFNKPYYEKNGYAYFNINPKDKLLISFDMKPVFMDANPQIPEDNNKVCLMRGPIVYCIEGVDNSCPLSSIRLDTDCEFELIENSQFLVPLIKTKGFKKPQTTALYAPHSKRLDSTPVTFIPYFAFANRGPSQMLVWVNAK